MYTLLLTYIHIITIITAALVGAYLFCTAKGTNQHRLLGKGYMLLVLTSALLSLLMPTAIHGLAINSHFGLIHLLSIFSIFCVIAAYVAIRRGLIRLHSAFMLGLYMGILIAGAFSFLPGRFLHSLF